MKLRREHILIGAIAVAVAMLVPMQRSLDAIRSELPGEEILYLPSGEAVKKLALGFEGIVSDIYWMRAIQYFGRKVEAGALKEGSTERFHLLAPLLGIATTLDPQYLIAYEFGGMFVADYDSPEDAATLLKKGIRNNPENWRLYQHLGFLYWKQKRYAEASEMYGEGSRLPGAPPFMRVMSAVVLAEGGSRKVAKQMFTQIAEESADLRMRQVMITKLRLLRALDEIEFLENGMRQVREKTGSFPGSLSLFAPLWHRAGIATDSAGFPVDPDGFRYKYEVSAGTITLADETTLPRRF